MKKSLQYLTEQVKKRLSASMFIFADQKYDILKKQKFKTLKICGFVGCISLCALTFMGINELSRVMEILFFISGLSGLLTSGVVGLITLIEFSDIYKQHKEFKNIDFSNEKNIIARFDELFTNDNYSNQQFNYRQYNWTDFDLQLKDDEIIYLMDTPLNIEQLKQLKETIFNKQQLSFQTLKNLQFFSNERVEAMNAAFQVFLKDHNQSTVAIQHSNNKENELEIAYNKYI